jgi:hypothetical protein
MYKLRFLPADWDFVHRISFIWRPLNPAKSESGESVCPKHSTRFFLPSHSADLWCYHYRMDYCGSYACWDGLLRQSNLIATCDMEFYVWQNLPHLVGPGPYRCLLVL